MDLTPFLIGLINCKPSPIVICDLDLRILFLNECAKVKYKKYGGEEMIGQLLEPYCTFEALTKLQMTVEWFKENKDKNAVFCYHDDDENSDVYLVAIRDSKRELIGFTSVHESRTPDNSQEYNID